MCSHKLWKGPPLFEDEAERRQLIFRIEEFEVPTCESDFLTTNKKKYIMNQMQQEWRKLIKSSYCIFLDIFKVLGLSVFVFCAP